MATEIYFEALYSDLVGNEHLVQTAVGSSSVVWGITSKNAIVQQRPLHNGFNSWQHKPALPNNDLPAQIDCASDKTVVVLGKSGSVYRYAPLQAEPALPDGNPWRAIEGIKGWVAISVGSRALLVGIDGNGAPQWYRGEGVCTGFENRTPALHKHTEAISVASDGSILAIGQNEQQLVTDVWPLGGWGFAANSLLGITRYSGNGLVSVSQGSATRMFIAQSSSLLQYRGEGVSEALTMIERYVEKGAWKTRPIAGTIEHLNSSESIDLHVQVATSGQRHGYTSLEVQDPAAWAPPVPGTHQ